MKWSSVLHVISAITGVVGTLTLLGAWIAGTDGTILGFNQAHLFNDTTALLLLSVAAGIGTMVHQKMES